MCESPHLEVSPHATRRKSPAWWMLVAMALFVSPPGAPAGEPLTITSDTVWRGTVDLSGDVRVEEGATLLLMPGTRVRFARPGGGDTPAARLEVRGALVAQGTSTEPILFTSAAQEPQVGDWGGIAFDSGSGRLRHCRIEYALAGIQARVSALSAEQCLLSRNKVGLSGGARVEGGLFDCEFADNDAGLYFNQSSGFLVEKCRVQRSARTGILCMNGSAPRITNCLIVDSQGDGIACVEGSSPLVEGNLIAGHERGIFVQLKSDPLIARNEFRGNQTAVWLQKAVSPGLVANVITRNQIGIFCNYSAYPEIRANNIFANERFALLVGDQQSIQAEKRIPYRSHGQYFSEAPKIPEPLPPQTRKFAPLKTNVEGLIDARGNWWGNEVAAEMKAGGANGNIGAIEDGADKPETDYFGEKVPRDRVAFAPWEEEPLAAAGRQEQKYSGIRGKVVGGGKPVAGARVHAYKTSDAAFRGEGFHHALTSEDGTFSLTVAPGRYYLVAKMPDPPFPGREPAEGQFYGYYGGNPVAVAEGQFTEANLQVLRRAAVGIRKTEGEAAVLEGVVLGPKGPEEGAALYAYPGAKSDFRGPDLSGPQGSLPEGTGPDGRFSVELPPGTYYLTASRRKEGPTLGPLRAGDHYGYFDGNPVTLEAGRTTSVTLQMTEKLKEVEAPRAAVSGLTSIRGVIREASGRPLSGVFAFASTDPNLIGSMPPFRSSRTGPDGAYRIDLPRAGTYYLGARSGYGGPPVPGQWQGFYGGDQPKPLSVVDGAALDAIDILVRRME